MSDIDVYLTTTKWAQAADDTETGRQLQRFDIPVCVTKFVMAIFGSDTMGPLGSESMENQWSQISKNMAKYVVIRPEKKFLYIGENPNASPEDNNEEDGLVIFTAGNGEYATHFFERWIQTRILMFEYLVYNNKLEPRFCLKGLWKNDHWHKLEIRPNNNLFIVSDSTDSKGG